MKHFTLILLPHAAETGAGENRLVKFEVVSLGSRTLRQLLGRPRWQRRHAAPADWLRRMPRLRQRQRR